MKVKPTFTVDCADHEGYLRLVSGEKKIITRAISSGSGDYSNSEQGDILELIDVLTDKKALALVKGLDKFMSVADLYRRGQSIAEETFNKKFSSESELRQEYEGNRPGYTKLIDQNGLIVWHIEMI